MAHEFAPGVVRCFVCGARRRCFEEAKVLRKIVLATAVALATVVAAPTESLAWHGGHGGWHGGGWHGGGWHGGGWHRGWGWRRGWHGGYYHPYRRGFYGGWGYGGGSCWRWNPWVGRWVWVCY